MRRRSSSSLEHMLNRSTFPLMPGHSRFKAAPTMLLDTKTTVLGSIYTLRSRHALIACYIEVTITGNLSRQTPGLANNDATSTVRLWTSNVKLYVSPPCDSAKNTSLIPEESEYCKHLRSSRSKWTSSRPQRTEHQPGFLRLQVHRLPRHHLRQRRPPNLRQILHQRRSRLHLRPSRYCVVRQDRH
jgi:hypothetical protein